MTGHVGQKSSLHFNVPEGSAAKPLKNNGEPCWVRTSDLLIKS
jgi:hypothetical protein